MPTAANYPSMEIFVAGMPIEHHKGNIPHGALVQIIIQCDLVADVANTFTLDQSYAELIHGTVMFKTSNVGDLFLEPPYFSLSGTTLSLIFKTTTPQAEGASIMVWVR